MAHIVKTLPPSTPHTQCTPHAFCSSHWLWVSCTCTCAHTSLCLSTASMLDMLNGGEREFSDSILCSWHDLRSTERPLLKTKVSVLLEILAVQSRCMDPQHQHHLGACQKCGIADPTPALLMWNLYFNKCACWSLRSTGLGHPFMCSYNLPGFLSIYNCFFSVGLFS